MVAARTTNFIPSLRTRPTRLRRCGLSLMLCLLAVSASDRVRAQTPAPAAKVAAASPGQTDTQTPADLAADARLDRHVSLHEVGLPLRSLLLQVDKDDLALAADHECADLELHLNLVNRPVRQLMTSLAQLVPGQWYHTPDGKGYTLRMNWRAVGRRQRWWDLYLAERQRVLQLLPEMAFEAMQAKPEIKGEAHSADGNDEGFRQFLLAGPTFFTQLPTPLQKQIANHLNEASLDSGSSGTGMNEGALMVPLADLPQDVQKRMIQFMRQPEGAKKEDCYILFKNNGSGISADPVDGSGATLGMGFGMSIPLHQAEPAFGGSPMWEVKRMERLHQDVPPVWKELAAYQESRVWPNVKPPKISYTDKKLFDASRMTNYRSDSISDLEQMADEDHLEFVSDYYSRPIGYGSVPTLRLTAQQKEEFGRLETRLNVLADKEDLSWKPTPEKIYLLRYNRWYINDRLEVPMPLLQRWLTHDVKEWVKPTEWTAATEAAQLRQALDWQAEVISVLTPDQIYGGLRWASVPAEKRAEYAFDSEKKPMPHEMNGRYRPFLHLMVQGLPQHYHLLQFYATLNKEQRTALLANALDFSGLTAQQQKMAVYIQPLLGVPARQGRPVTLGLGSSLGSREIGYEVRLIIAPPAAH